MRLSIASAIACVLATVAIADQSRATATNVPNNGVGAGFRPTSKAPVNIAAQDLSTALKTFAEQSKLYLIYAQEDVINHRTAGASGELTQDEVLKRLLWGTGLTYRLLAENTITIVPIDKSAASSRDINEVTPIAPRNVQLVQNTQNSENTDSSFSTSSDGEENKVTEIVVTAQKRGEERLQDVPIPVTALNADTLTNSNQLQLRDYFNSIPGLQVAPAPGLNGGQPLSIRGINSGGGDATVGITIDDTPFRPTSTPEIDPGDLVRVEVLRGPQGTLYGANSMGGLIKYVTVDPSFDGVAGRLQAGTHGIKDGSGVGYNFRGALNVPMGHEFALRASAHVRKDPGYIDNPRLGTRDVNKVNAYGGMVAGLWKPTDDISLKVTALLQDNNADGRTEILRNVNGYAGPPVQDLQQTYLRGTGAIDTKIQAYNGVFSAKIGIIDVTSITGYNISNYVSSIDFSYALGAIAASQFGANFTGVPINGRAKNKQLSQELRFLVPLGQKFDWLIGGFYSDYRFDYVQDSPATDPNTLVTAGSVIRIPINSGDEQISGFTNLTYHLTDKFDLQAGVRQSHVSTFQRQNANTGVLFPGGTFTSPANSSTFNSFTYLVTPSYRLSQDLMVYGRVATGYRFGGPNNLNPNPAIPRVFSPDKTTNYELGAKGDFFDNMLTVDMSVYYIDWDGIQISQRDTCDCVTRGISFTGNGGKAKSEGTELSFELRPSDGLKIGAAFVYSNAVLTENFPAGSTVSGVKGAALPYSAKYTTNLTVDQSFALTEDVMAYVGATFSYVDGRYGIFQGFTSTGAPAPRQYLPSYTRTDLRAGMKYGLWTLDIYANNVADKRGLLGGGIGTFPPYAFSITAPRTIGASVTRTF